MTSLAKEISDSLFASFFVLFCKKSSTYHTMQGEEKTHNKHSKRLVFALIYGLYFRWDAFHVRYALANPTHSSQRLPFIQVVNPNESRKKG